MKITELNEKQVEMMLNVLEHYIYTEAENLETDMANEITTEADFDEHSCSQAIKLWFDLGKDYQSHSSYECWKKDAIATNTPYIEEW